MFAFKHVRPVFLGIVAQIALRKFRTAQIAQIARIAGTTVPQSYQTCVRKLCLFGYKHEHPDFPDIMAQSTVRKIAQKMRGIIHAYCILQMRIV